MIGDFNVVISFHEITGSSRNIISIEKFNIVVFYCNLVDTNTKRHFTYIRNMKSPTFGLVETIGFVVIPSLTCSPRFLVALIIP